MARPPNSSDVFRAIAHPVRRKMLEMLRKRALTVSELAQPFHMSQPAISEHLRALRETGLVSYRARRNQHVYTLVRSRLRALEEWVRLFEQGA